MALPAEALVKKSIWPPASFGMMTAPAPTPPRAVLLFWNTRLLPKVTSKFCAAPELLTMPAALTVNGLPIVIAGLRDARELDRANDDDTVVVIDGRASGVGERCGSARHDRVG